MCGCVKRVLNRKGLSLMELVVAIMVFSIIMAVTVSLVGPVLRTFERANNFAEANTMLDNIAAIITADLKSVMRPIPNPAGGVLSPIFNDPGNPNMIFGLRAPHNVRYYIGVREVSPGNSVNVLIRHDTREGIAPDVIAEAGRVFDGGFHRNIDFGFAFDWDEWTDNWNAWISDSDPLSEIVITFTLSLASDHGWNVQRSYTVRPLGLVRV